MVEKENEQQDNFIKYHMPRWDELPDLDLYLDQVVNYLEKYLINYTTNK